MPAPNFEFYESDSNLSGGTIIDENNKIDFGKVPIGVIGLPIDPDKQFIHLWNDKGGALGSDTAQNIKLYLVASDGDNSDEFITGTDGNGNKPVIEARSTNSLNTPADAQDDWVPIGPSDLLGIGDMPSNSMRVIEIRANTPVDMPVHALEDFELRVSTS